MEIERTPDVAPDHQNKKTKSVHSQLNNTEEKNISVYLKAVMPELPKGFMKNNPWRIVNAFVAYGIIAAGAFVLISYELPVLVKVFLGLAMGSCFAINGFLAHEALHGSIFQKKFLQDLVGFFGFALVFNAPTFWRHEHNKMHHGNTQKLLIDPDAFPTKRIFKQSKYSQRVYKFLPGSKTLRSYLYFFYWFTFHNLMAQTYFRFRNKTYDGVDHTRCTVELILQFAVIGGYGYLLGWPNLIYGLVIPFFVMNYTLMSYISTNHNFLPLVRENDPFEAL
ncbi:MAG: fatty acid desaturase [Bdellovibrionales bacterium]